MTSKRLVLVVEDEPLVRIGAVQMLEEAGYEVLSAPDADEAIALLEQHPEISLLFTDVQMPGSMDGVRLAEAVRKRWPPIRIVVTSGRPRPDQLEDDTLFVPKPYDWATLNANLDAAFSVGPTG